MWNALPAALLGVLIVLLPLTVIAIYASRLSPRQRAAILTLYGVTLLLLIIIVGNIGSLLSR